jgi:hypothetical protein
MTGEAARLAGEAWFPGEGSGYFDFCSGECFRRLTSSRSAIWCFSGTFEGKVSLFAGLAILCPPQGAISDWD